MVHTGPDYSEEYRQAKIYGMIDSAELAVRSKGLMSIDRRGNVFWWDDFESTNDNKWAYGGDVGAAHALSTTKAFLGEQSMLLTTPASINNYSTMTKDFSMPFARCTGSEIWLHEGSNLPIAGLIFYGYSGTEYCSPEIRYNFATNVLSYMNSAGGYTTLPTYDSFSTTYEQWIPIKLVVDWDTGYYVRLIFLGTEYDLSTVEMYTVANLTKPRIHVVIYAKATQNLASTAYFDNFIITQNE